MLPLLRALLKSDTTSCPSTERPKFQARSRLDGSSLPNSMVTERAFSHGCIRTQNPFDFAEHLLDNQGWDRARIDRVVESGKTTRVNLETPVTVMLLYWTTDVAEDGTVRFKKDVYGRDAKIIAGLAEPFRVDPPEGIREAVDGQGGSR